MTQEQKVWLSGSVGILIFSLFFYFFKPVLTPFLIAALFAYLGNPLIKRLTLVKVPHTLAVIIVFSTLMLALLALILFLIPLLTRQFEVLMQNLPAWMAWLQQFVLPWLNQHLGITISFDLQDLRTVLAQHWQQVAIVWKTIASSGLAIVSWIINLLLIPIVLFYLLRDWDSLVTELRDLLPRRIEPTVVNIVKECNNVLGAFFHGQFLVMLTLAIFYSLGLSIIGLDFALLIGITTGILTIIPYLGFSIGLLSGVIATFVQFHTWLPVGYTVILYAVGQVLESYFLVPWLIGHRIGLHPVAVIFAVLAGGHLFGFVGVLIALPVAAVIMVLLRHLKQHYVKSTLYKHKRSQAK